MSINKLESRTFDVDRENYIPLLKETISVSDNGWTVYVDSPGVNPVDGLGGSPAINWNLNSSSPLSGLVDLRLIKGNSNCQGNGASIPFTIENRHLGKVLQISFDTEFISGNYESPIITQTAGTYIIATGNCTVTANHSFVPGQVVTMTFGGSTPPPSGTYLITGITATTFVFAVPSGTAASATPCFYTVPADLRVSIIQDPTGTPVAIEPVNTGIQLGIANQRIRHIATFQTHISIRNYRLCIHVANASTVEYTVDFANFKVWEPQQSIGTVITDWQSYTPTLIGVSGVSNLEFQWRRVGGNCEIRGKFSNTTGSAVEMRIPLPSGLTSSGTDRIPSIQVCGVIQGTYVSVSLYTLSILIEPNVTYMTYGTIQVSGASTNHLIKRLGSDFFSSANTASLQASIPIAGWGSSVAMSSDTGDGRVVAANYSGNPTLQGGNFVTFGTRQFDTHNAYNTSNGTYTCPVSGVYRISTTFGNTGTGLQVYINRNGTNVAYLFQAPANPTYVTSGSANVICNAGDTLKLAIGGSNALYGSDATQNISIERISAGSQVIAATEGVAMTATKTTGSIAGNGAVTAWNAATLDTHGGWNPTLGEYTVPTNGVYIFYTTANDNSPINNTVSVRFQTNISGSFVDIPGTADVFYNASVTIWPNLRTTMIRRCIAGEKIRSYSNYSGSGFAAGIWTPLQFSVARIGI